MDDNTTRALTLATRNTYTGEKRKHLDFDNRTSCQLAQNNLLCPSVLLHLQSPHIPPITIPQVLFCCCVTHAYTILPDRPTTLLIFVCKKATIENSTKYIQTSVTCKNI